MRLDFLHTISLLALTSTISIVTVSCSKAATAPTKGTSPTEPVAGSDDGTASDLRVLETIAIHGFEQTPTNDPEVRRMSDGSLFVVFNCMPPCFTPDVSDGPPPLGQYAHFDAEMQAALGVDVSWEDREFFRIRNPTSDTISRLQTFVSGYHHHALAP